MPSLPDSPDATLLIHNPRCSKSRQTLALLEERGVDFEVRAYLADPLSRAELAELQKRLDRPVHDWVRPGEGRYEEAGLSVDTADEALLDAIAKHPEILQRPIVVHGGRAEIGRPPEQVLALFDE